MQMRHSESRPNQEVCISEVIRGSSKSESPMYELMEVVRIRSRHFQNLCKIDVMYTYRPYYVETFECWGRMHMWVSVAQERKFSRLHRPFDDCNI